MAFVGVDYPARLGRFGPWGAVGGVAATPRCEPVQCVERRRRWECRGRRAAAPSAAAASVRLPIEPCVGGATAPTAQTPGGAVVLGGAPSSGWAWPWGDQPWGGQPWGGRPRGGWSRGSRSRSGQPRGAPGAVSVTPGGAGRLGAPAAAGVTRQSTPRVFVCTRCRRFTHASGRPAAPVVARWCQASAAHGGRGPPEPFGWHAHWNVSPAPVVAVGDSRLAVRRRLCCVARTRAVQAAGLDGRHPRRHL